MTALPVEWVLAIYYGLSAHRATYGRLAGTTYTKDYIQLSRKPEFLEDVAALFQSPQSNPESIPIVYRWPIGQALGKLILKSADRPHLSWETHAGAPPPWKMSTTPADAAAETIQGNPNHQSSADADQEFYALESKGIGRPYLLAIKLKGDNGVLHLRTYIANPSITLGWADTKLLPAKVQQLLSRTSQNSALAWSRFHSQGVLPSVKASEALAAIGKAGFNDGLIEKLDDEAKAELAAFLESPAVGLFFDPDINHDAWQLAQPAPEADAAVLVSFVEKLKAGLPDKADEGDVAAEALEVSDELVSQFEAQLEAKNYSVTDAFSNTKTRGSAQRVFANAVKGNYGYRCAITGITSKEFLVASHIVPWSADHSIRLDPSNGICLSLIVDRAFERGFLTIADDLTISIKLDKVGTDIKLKDKLMPYDGKKLTSPTKDAPNSNYLQRRRKLIDES